MNCVVCGKKLVNRQKKFCSNQCQANQVSHEVVARWLEGSDSGLNTESLTKPAIRRWLIERAGGKCEICGWNQINPVTGLSPLVVDHINGDYKHNVPDNLRILCPNCDSLQPTYKALNEGKGRKMRMPG